MSRIVLPLLLAALLISALLVRGLDSGGKLTVERPGSRPKPSVSIHEDLAGPRAPGRRREPALVDPGADAGPDAPEATSPGDPLYPFSSTIDDPWLLKAERE